jgi:hypothetical protein
MSFTSQAPFNAEEVVQLKAENEQLKLEVKQLRLEAEQAKALELAKVRAHERALYKEYRSLVSTKLDDCFEVTRFKAIGFDHIFTDKTLLQVYNNFRAGWYGAHRETHIDPLLDDFEQKYTRYLKHFWTKVCDLAGLNLEILKLITLPHSLRGSGQPGIWSISFTVSRRTLRHLIKSSRWLRKF